MWLILTYLLSCTISEIYESIGPKSPYLATPVVFNSPDGGRRGSPGTISVSFFPGCQRMTSVSNAAEILLKITTGWVGCASVTDRQTDRQTIDGRATAYSVRKKRERKWKTRGWRCFTKHKPHVLEATLRNNLGQVVHTYLPLSPNNITWYRPKGGDALRLGR